MSKFSGLWLDLVASLKKRYEPINSLKRQHGFTMIELIMVLLIVGILAAFVAPRFIGRQAFDTHGFHNQTLTFLRYAQKVAIAQRRNICVSFGNASITLTIANTAGSNVGCIAANTIALSGPNGENPYSISAPSGIYFTNTENNTATPTNFTFDALGKASVGQIFRISGLSENITVEQETGFVHR
jgi:MSHA pilin protein MshC